MLTLSQLLTPQTADVILGILLASLQAAAVPFPITNWTPGGTARTLLKAFSDSLAQLSLSIVNIAAGGFVDYAPGLQTLPFVGDWLGLLAHELYELDRFPAIATQEQILLSDPNGAGPYTIAAGQLYVSDGNGHTYINVNGGTLPHLGTLVLTVQAETAGSAYSAGIGQITVILTPLPGVVCNNPQIGVSGTAIVVQGTDPEPDTSLRARCKARWPSLSLQAPTPAVYQLWAATASNQVTRSTVSADPVVGGQVDLCLAGASGGVTGAVVAAVVAYITPLLPIGAILNAFSATTVAIDVSATIYCAEALIPSARAAVTTALNAYINGVPIAGTVFIDPGLPDCFAQPGVRNIEGLTPGADVVLGANEVAVPGTYTLNFVAI